MKNNKKIFAYLIDAIVMMINVYYASSLVNARKMTSALLLVWLVAAVLLYFYRRDENRRCHLVWMAGAAVGAFAEILWLAGSVYAGYLIAMVMAMFIAIGMFYSCMMTLSKKRKAEGKRRFFIIIGNIAAVPFILFSAFYLAVAVNPNVLVKTLQNTVMAAENSFEPAKASTQTKLPNSGTYINDICYGEEYPNSYLDVYLSPVPGEEKPTYVFIHGGGYVWGDKVGGDPNSPSAGMLWYISEFLNAGYNVVCPNYCFAPEYTYPTQIVQLNEMLRFLTEQGDNYGIAMDKVVLGGQSAGGNIAGMLGVISTNQQAAEAFHTTGYLTGENLLAVVFSSALINNEEFTVSHDKTNDWLFYQCGRAAMSTNELRGHETARLTNITAWVDENYPPSYISDGNTGSFYSQAEVLHEKLDTLNVENRWNFYPRVTEILVHGYETEENSPSARENMQELLNFLNQYINN